MAEERTRGKSVVPAPRACCLGAAVPQSVIQLFAKLHPAVAFPLVTLEEYQIALRLSITAIFKHAKIGVTTMEMCNHPRVRERASARTGRVVNLFQFCCTTALCTLVKK